MVLVVILCSVEQAACVMRACVVLSFCVLCFFRAEHHRKTILDVMCSVKGWGQTGSHLYRSVPFAHRLLRVPTCEQ